MKLRWSALLLLLTSMDGWPQGLDSEKPLSAFNSVKDVISLHYDHAPDKDDGQSAAADRTILESLYGVEWIESHVIPVSGTYGKNKKTFNPESDAVMDAAWNDCGGWRSADDSWDTTADGLTKLWLAVIEAGGSIWVKEGGQSDLTADVVRRIRRQSPDLDTTAQIHVVQHSDWNEMMTTDEALAYTKANTDYVRISDANAYLNVKGGDAAFVQAATGHSVFGPVWRVAFAYYDPNYRLDFSDTGELLHILGLGRIGFDAFRETFLQARSEKTP